ncbi:MAG TPA: helix-turn-helix domain-containing protein [Streptosporangiaceae bacterium]|jgi:transcriptional regulator with XRE-family HTH domain|nr:helix-turn-helix domain-containing protein [Streptosporangiaceae bacterium]
MSSSDAAPGGTARSDASPGGAPRSDPASELWQRQMDALGGFIRMQRRLADMSLREMASLTSVSNAYLSQIERGLHQPSLRVLRSIAQALGIAPEDLLRRANFMAPTEDDVLDAEQAGPAPPDTEAAIAADPRLTPTQREALLNVYRSFRDSS